MKYTMNKNFVLVALCVLICGLLFSNSANASKLILFDEDVDDWSSAAILNSDYQQKGIYSMEWRGFGSSNSTLSLSSPVFPLDLSKYKVLTFWAYSPTISNSKFNIICYSSSDGYFSLTNQQVDWQGWKKFEILLSSMNKAYNADWSNITSLEFKNYGWGVEYTSGAVLYIDNVFFDIDKSNEIILLDEDCYGWNNLVPTTAYAKRGNYSGAWNSFGKPDEYTSGESVVSVKVDDIPDDWSTLYSISFWAYSPGISSAKFNLIIHSAGGYFFKLQIPVNWSGWKRFEYPLTAFGKSGDADWSKVIDLTFYNYGWGITPVIGAMLYLDDLRLNNSYKMFFDENVAAFSNTIEEHSSQLVWKGNISAELNGFATSNKQYSIKYPEIITDWSKYDVLSFRMHANTASGSTFNLIIHSVGGYFFKLNIPVNWSGWKRFEYPLTAFGKSGDADWSKIIDLTFYNYGWGVSPVNNGTELHIDDIELYKKSAFNGIVWSDIFTYAKNNDNSNIQFEAVILQRGAGLIPLVRPYSLDEIIENGAAVGADLMDPRVANFPDGHPNKTTFALAMADASAAIRIKDKLFNASIRVVTENDLSALAYIIEQLKEVVGYDTGHSAWHPLQRPGWTKYNPNDYTALPVTGDGVWLATSHGLFAIIDTLEAVGDRLSPELKNECIKFINKEIEQIEISWHKSIPWYINSPGSNQFILPNAGLLYACLYTGRGDSTLLMAINNSLASIEFMGNDGSYVEGFAYNDMSTPVLCRTAWMLRDNSYIDLVNSDFLQKNGDWLISHLMPGNFLLNAFDGPLGTYSVVPGALAMLSATVNKFEYQWIIENVFNNLYSGVSEHALLYHYYKQNTTVQPKNYGYYPSRNLMSWRSGWNNDTDTGIWAKGADVSDNHIHQDAGHVSFYFGKQAVLIEAGSPPYSTLDYRTKYSPLVGHNVLQATPNAGGETCLMTVNSLTDSGGDILIDGTSAYTDVENWQRRIVFKVAGCTITDQIDLETNKTGGSDEWLRFHTGSQSPVTISGTGMVWHVTFANAKIEFVADKNIQVSQIEWVNRSLSDTISTHYCIIIKTVDSIDKLNLVTSISKN